MPTRCTSRPGLSEASDAGAEADGEVDGEAEEDVGLEPGAADMHAIMADSGAGPRT